jgi:hypothetical protein
MDKNIEQLKNDYEKVKIPEEIDFLVKRTLKENGVNLVNRKKGFNKFKITALSTIAALALLTIGLNCSPAFAAKLAQVPVVGSIVKVLTFREYVVNEDTYNSNIVTPAIEGLGNKELESSLNEKYLEENKKLYEEFLSEIEELKKSGGGHLGVDSGYIVKTDTDSILSVGRYIVNTVGSSSTTMKYDTIDKKSQVLITLPSLFKNNEYVERISENIKAQMFEQYKADKDNFYWVEGIEQDPVMELFEKIAEEQSFYINPEGKLVISFDKYEVAPGYMGVCEFTIPTESIKDLLVSNNYIK